MVKKRYELHAEPGFLAMSLPDLGVHGEHGKKTPGRSPRLHTTAGMQEVE